jgi:hypothetical protein
MTDHIDAARRVARAVAPPIQPPAFRIEVCDAVINALDRAGLLRTDIEQRAIKACERYAEACQTFQVQYTDQPYRDILVVGRESLAAKQPKPRWTVVATENAVIRWRVLDAHRTDEPMAGFAYESDARAYAASKNALTPEKER